MCLCVASNSLSHRQSLVWRRCRPLVPLRDSWRTRRKKNTLCYDASCWYQRSGHKILSVDSISMTCWLWVTNQEESVVNRSSRRCEPQIVQDLILTRTGYLLTPMGRCLWRPDQSSITKWWIPDGHRLFPTLSFILRPSGIEWTTATRDSQHLSCLFLYAVAWIRLLA